MGIVTTISTAAILADPSILMREAREGNTVFISDLGYTLAPTADITVVSNLSELIAEEANEAEDMASLRKEVTGVDNTIFVSTKGYGRHAARIKIAVDPPDSLNAASKTASMRIHDYATVGEPLPRHIYEQAVRFIDRNRDLLLAYWNEQVDTATLIRQLKPPQG